MTKICMVIVGLFLHGIILGAYGNKELGNASVLINHIVANNPGGDFTKDLANVISIIPEKWTTRIANQEAQNKNKQLARLQNQREQLRQKIDDKKNTATSRSVIIQQDTKTYKEKEKEVETLMKELGLQ